MFLLVSTAAGCATMAPVSPPATSTLDVRNDARAAASTGENVGFRRGMENQNDERIRLHGVPREQAWQEIERVVQAHFDIDQEAHGRVIGDNLLTRDRIDEEPAFAIRPVAEIAGDENTMTSAIVRRRGFVHLEETDDGLLLDVNVFQDAGEGELPPLLTAGMRGNIAATPGESQSVNMGRDRRFEDSLTEEIRDRLDGLHPLPGALPGPLESGTLSETLFSATPRQVWRDHLNFYSPEGITSLAILLGGSAVVANTSIDTEIMEKYQGQVRGPGTDNFAKIVKPLGDGVYTLPIIVGATLLANMSDRVPLPARTGEWGGRTIRGLAVGAPPFLLLQYVLGSSRPDVMPFGSRWEPWKDKHGVSGHAYMSAVPFITAAKMTDNPYWKAGLYFGSTVTGWSRINDHDHYLSQVIMGWGLAYLAATAVDETARGEVTYKVVPLPIPGVSGMGIEIRR
jgi:membrane-associated phospholipid phosphatase